MKRKKDFPWELLSRIIIILSLFNLWGLAIMSIKDIPTAIWVAIIGAAATIIGTLIANTGSLIGQGRQLKRDGKTIEQIRETANTAPASLEKAIQNSEAKICEKLTDQDKNLIASLTEIKSSTGAMQRQIENLNMHRANSPVQMNALVAAITEMYAQHDRDQKTIESLQNEIAELKRRNQELENTLLQRDLGNGSRTQDDWEPEY